MRDIGKGEVGQMMGGELVEMSGEDYLGENKGDAVVVMENCGRESRSWDVNRGEDK